MMQLGSALNWRSILIQWVMITIGTLIGAMGIVIFLEPFEIAPSGLTGVALIMSIKLGTPIGLVVLLGNIPIQYFAYRYLGGLKPLLWTLYVLVLFAASIDWFTPLFPASGISDDILLNAIFGGVIGGLGAGLVYRQGATFGGTSTIAMIFQRKLGLPLSTTYLYANLGTVALAGLVLGWAGALYAIIALALEGMASDYVLEGPSVIRTAVIITDYPKEVAEGIMYQLQRGVTSWQATGMYTGRDRTILYVTVSRFQIGVLRQIVAGIDENAFVVIGQGHVAYGIGFRPVKETNILEENTTH